MYLLNIVIILLLTRSLEFHKSKYTDQSLDYFCNKLETISGNTTGLRESLLSYFPLAEELYKLEYDNNIVENVTATNLPKFITSPVLKYSYYINLIYFPFGYIRDIFSTIVFFYWVFRPAISKTELELEYIVSSPLLSTTASLVDFCACVSSSLIKYLNARQRLLIPDIFRPFFMGLSYLYDLIFNFTWLMYQTMKGQFRIEDILGAWRLDISDTIYVIGYVTISYGLWSLVPFMFSNKQRSEKRLKTLESATEGLVESFKHMMRAICYLVLVQWTITIVFPLLEAFFSTLEIIHQCPEKYSTLFMYKRKINWPVIAELGMLLFQTYKLFIRPIKFTFGLFDTINKITSEKAVGWMKFKFLESLQFNAFLELVNIHLVGQRDRVLAFFYRYIGDNEKQVIYSKKIREYVGSGDALHAIVCLLTFLVSIPFTLSMKNPLRGDGVFLIAVGSKISEYWTLAMSFTKRALRYIGHALIHRRLIYFGIHAVVHTIIIGELFSIHITDGIAYVILSFFQLIKYIVSFILDIIFIKEYYSVRIIAATLVVEAIYGRKIRNQIKEFGESFHTNPVWTTVFLLMILLVISYDSINLIKHPH